MNFDIEIERGIDAQYRIFLLISRGPCHDIFANIFDWQSLKELCAIHGGIRFDILKWWRVDPFERMVEKHSKEIVQSVDKAPSAVRIVKQFVLSGQAGHPDK